MMVIKNNPFVAWTILATTGMFIIQIFDIQYDSSPENIIILTSVVWGFILWVPGEILFELNDGKSFEGKEIIVILLALSISFVLDKIIRTWKKRKLSEDAN